MPQGSQVFARDQLRALRAAGADPTLLCYGTGAGAAPRDLRVLRAPAALSPRRLRAGPDARKPLADAALLLELVAAQRRRPFRVALAHNAEAACIALAARAVTRLPVVYVAHTLLGRELSSYAGARLRPALDAAGVRIDRALARRADALIALSHAAARALAPHARGPIEVIPPGATPAPPPGAEAVARACRRHGLEPGRFALYAGNLDRYQGLDLLVAAARRAPELPIALATHAEAPRDAPPLPIARVRDYAEMRALTAGAGLALLPRRCTGGFPIKLLSYMEAGRAIVAYEALAEGLEHDRTAWLLPREAGAAAWAEAIGRLLADPERARRLGRAARHHLERRHAWPRLAQRTLAIAEGAAARAASGRRARRRRAASC